MTHLPSSPDTGGGIPAWVKISGTIALIVILLIVVIMLSGGDGGIGGHTPPEGGH